MNQQITVKIWRISRWWLLLLLVPLLLIPLEKDVYVKVIDSTGTTVSNADVSLVYTESYLYKNTDFFLSNEDSLYQKTDSAGVASFDSLPSSVYSFVFHHFTKLATHSKNGCFQSEHLKKRYHYIWSGDTLLLTLKQNEEDVRFQVLDDATDDPIKHVLVKFKYSYNNSTKLDTARSDEDGYIVFYNIPYCARLEIISCEHAGYYPAEIVDKEITEVLKEDFTRELRLIPIKKCNETSQTDGNEIEYVQVFDLVKKNGQFTFEYNTQNIPDEFTIKNSNDRVLWTFNGSTNDLIETVTINFDTPLITIEVTKSGSGSSWDYKVNCP